MDIHTVIVTITVLILWITVSDVLTSRLVAPKNKREIITVCIFIFVASVCECIGEKANGAAPEFINLHRFAKLAEFCTAPCIAVAAANAYGKLNYKKFSVLMLAAHAVFEAAAFFNGLVFYVDEQNVYHRQGLYWIYIAAFVMSIFLCYVCLIRGNRKYQARLWVNLIAILVFLSFGIGIQMIYSGIPVDFMCVAIGNFCIYHYRGNIINQVDATTKLLNRRCYQRSLQNIKSPAYILIFDVNNFKKINDTYGHAEGDKCLEDVAKLLLSVYGKYGFCYRIGGDEFCVIMYKSLEKIEALNKSFSEGAKEIRLHGEKIYGVSFGCVYYDENETEIADAVNAADEMMYENKRKGKI